MRVELLGLLLVGLLSGCFPSGGGFASNGATCSEAAESGGDDDDDGSGDGGDDHEDRDDDDDDRDPPTIETLEESDIYRIDGETLYVYSYSKGLSVIDVSVPATPAIVGQVAVSGPAGELYAREGRVALLLDAATAECTAQVGPADTASTGQLDLISGNPPALRSRTCLAGQIVASRRIGDRIYFVTTDDTSLRSWVFSIDISDMESPALIDLVELDGTAHEIHLSESLRLYVAEQEWTPDQQPRTRVRIFDLADENGGIEVRGQVIVEGSPRGRFHMDEWESTFRIVTYHDWNMDSMLHVIDVSDADSPALVGSLDAIAPFESLHATRFDGELAYLVTFRQTDPLWVVDLHDPAHPSIVGELVVPGWSDYIFPRGDQLLAVGRAQWGGVGMSLFDVSDPANPQTLAQLEFGDWLSSSEATADFRGVGIAAAGALAANDVIALPVNQAYYDSLDGAISCQNSLHFVEISGGTLGLRGSLQSSARVRRSVAIEGKLYSISDLEVAAVDVSDLNAPQVTTVLPVGDSALLADQCWIDELGGWGGDDWGDDMAGDDMGCGSGGCSIAGASGTGTPVVPALLLAALVLALRGGRRRLG